MKNLRNQFNRFIYNNRDRGIPNLMMYLCGATMISYFLMLADSSNMFYSFVCFNRSAILQGQIWRLFTYVLVPQSSGLWLFLLLFAYYSIGRMVEQVWGTLKFNLFYLSGVLIMDVVALIMGATASTYYLNLSLFLALATMYPDSRVMLMYIIPLKMKYLAWVYLLILLTEIVQMDLFPAFALLNYFLFFGWDWINVLPEFMQEKLHRSGQKSQARPNPNWAQSYKKATKTKPKERVVDMPNYRHKCTICGKTDVSHPGLEFRYCSRCTGYYCYCENHINNHPHIQ